METEFEDLGEEEIVSQAPPQKPETDIAGEDDFDVEIEGEGEELDPDNEADESAAGKDDDAQAAAGEELGPIGDDDDLLPYSAKVQKRIMRERKAKREAIAERDAIKAEHDRMTAELNSERTRRAEAEAHLVSTAENSIEAEIAAKTIEFKTAKENGDTDLEISLMDELDQLKDDRKVIRSAKASQPVSKEESPAPAPAAKEENELTKAWRAKNAWMGDKRYVAQATATLTLDRQIFSEGILKPDTQAYFDELDRRIDESMKRPNAAAAPVVVPPKQKPKAALSPVVGAGNDGDAAPVNRNKVTLTKADLATMERYGLDTRNKDHLREFARNKITANGR